jgi:hypothetical protein
MYIGIQSTFKYLSELTWNYVIDRKNECGFITKITAEVTVCIRWFTRSFFLSQPLVKISDKAEQNGDYFRTK